MAWIVLIIGGILIGLTLGVMGSGGSILTVPVLVYLVGHPDKVAIAESMAIVGLISLVTVIPFARASEVDWRSVIFFGIPGTLGTYLGAWLSKFIPGPVQLICFAIILFLAAALMLRNRRPKRVNDAPDAAKDPPSKEPKPTMDDAHHSLWKIILEGTTVGVVTGIVGVGGGFLIVPALVLLGGLSMRVAVGTSLAIITMKSVSGFYKHAEVLSRAGSDGPAFEWSTVLLTVSVFAAFGLVGSFAGRRIAQRINADRLKTTFGYFLVVMGIVILTFESSKMLDASNDAPPQASPNVRVKG